MDMFSSGDRRMITSRDGAIVQNFGRFGASLARSRFARCLFATAKPVLDYMLAFRLVHLARTLVPTDLMNPIAATTIKPVTTANSSVSAPHSSAQSRVSVFVKNAII